MSQEARAWARAWLPAAPAVPGTVPGPVLLVPGRVEKQEAVPDRVQHCQAVQEGVHPGPPQPRSHSLGTRRWLRLVLFWHCLVGLFTVWWLLVVWLRLKLSLVQGEVERQS